MGKHRLISCLFVVLLISLSLMQAGVAQTPGETVLEASNFGQVFVLLPDQTRLDFGPGTMGPGWTNTQTRYGFMVKGNADDLFKDGQTTSLGVCGNDGKRIEVFARLQVDEQDKCLLHFLYRFTATDPLKLNSLVVALRLPAKFYEDANLAALKGPPCEATLGSPVGQSGHLLNGLSGGVDIAAGKSNALRVEFDAPHWITISDQRRWNKLNSAYKVELMALVNSKGTSLTAGQSAQISGTIRFPAPLRLQPPAPVQQQVQRLSPAQLHPDLTNGCLPRWRDDAGDIVMASSILDLNDVRPSPQPEQVTAIPGPDGTTTIAAKLWSEVQAGEGFDLWQQSTARPGELTTDIRLTAFADHSGAGVWYGPWIARKFVEGAKVHFLGTPGGHDPTVTLAPGFPDLGRALATGVRVEAEGQPIFQLLGDSLRLWEIQSCQDGYIINQWLLGYPAAPFAVRKGVTYPSTLKCVWGQ